MSSTLKREACDSNFNEQKKLKSKLNSINKIRCGLTWCGQDNWHQNPKRGHPERPDRVGCIIEYLEKCDILKKCKYIDYSKWNDIDNNTETAVIDANNAMSSFIGSERLNSKLSDVHNPYYLTRFSSKRLNKLSSQPHDGLYEESLQYDSIYLSLKSGDAARRAVAASLSLADALVNKEIKNGFAIVRPPGHHAEPCAAKGFCLFNNVGVVAKHLKSLNEKVLIVDFDVHHGNGTAMMFNNVSNPCYMSLHRHDEGSFFPGASTHVNYKKNSSNKSLNGKVIHPASAFDVGSGDGIGHNINIAWDGKGAGDLEYITAFQKVLIPIALSYEPTVILVSAGFDAAIGDLIGGCKVTPKGYGVLIRMLSECIPSAKGRVLLFLEGGYLLSVLPECAKACVDVLVDVASSDQDSEQDSEQRDTDNHKPSQLSNPNHENDGNFIDREVSIQVDKVVELGTSGLNSSDVNSEVGSACTDRCTDTPTDIQDNEEDELEDWAVGLLPAAVYSIRDTIEAHAPHWPLAPLG